MTVEIDHAFLCAGSDEEAAAAITALTAFGLNLSHRRVHRGQGTRNACAFFDNFYLEILWPTEDSELDSHVVAPLMLRERLNWRATGACPIGLSFRIAKEARMDIETWPYAPPYLRGGPSIRIVTPRCSPQEPLVFLSASPAPVGFLTDDSLLIHRGSKRRLTNLRIALPDEAVVSSAPAALLAAAGVGLTTAEGPHLEMEWDAGSQGRAIDFSDVLPLSIRW